MIAAAALARPYARALFEYAQSNERVELWQEVLADLQAIAGAAQLQAVLASPVLPKADKVELLQQISKHDGKYCANFLALLAQSNRLTLLPEIYAQYRQLALSAQAVMEVQVESAHDLSEQEVEALSAKLKAKWSAQRLKLDVKLNPELLAGVVCRSGDQSIDYSLKGRLERLATNLSS